MKIKIEQHDVSDDKQDTRVDTQRDVWNGYLGDKLNYTKVCFLYE